MSQYARPAEGGDPAVPTSFVTDDGTAVPVANTLNVLARDTNENNDEGIQTTADPAGGQNLYVELTNRVEVGATTIGAGTSNVTLVDFSAAPFSGTTGCYNFMLQAAGFEPTSPAGAYFTVKGGVLTDGTTPSLVGTPDEDFDNSAAIAGVNATLAISGNELVLQLTGVAGFNITWQSVSYYVRATL